MEKTKIIWKKNSHQSEMSINESTLLASSNNNSATPVNDFRCKFLHRDSEQELFKLYNHGVLTVRYIEDVYLEDQQCILNILEYIRSAILTELEKVIDISDDGIDSVNY